MSSALAGGKDATPRSAAWFGEDADPMLLGEGTDSSPPGSVICPCLSPDKI